MSYIVQRPHTNTNPTDKHRVIQYGDWERHAYHGAPAPESYGDFSSSAEAVECRDKLNAGMTSS